MPQVDVTAPAADRDVGALTPTLSKLSRTFSDINVVPQNRDAFGGQPFSLSQPISGNPRMADSPEATNPRRLFASPGEEEEGMTKEKSPVPLVGHKSIVHQGDENEVSNKASGHMKPERSFTGVDISNTSLPPMPLKAASSSMLFPGATSNVRTEAMELDCTPSQCDPDEPRKTTPKRKLDTERPAPVVMHGARARALSTDGTIATETAPKLDRVTSLRRAAFTRSRGVSCSEFFSSGFGDSFSVPGTSPRERMGKASSSSAIKTDIPTVQADPSFKARKNYRSPRHTDLHGLAHDDSHLHQRWGSLFSESEHSFRDLSRSERIVARSHASSDVETLVSRRPSRTGEAASTTDTANDDAEGETYDSLAQTQEYNPEDDDDCDSTTRERADTILSMGELPNLARSPGSMHMRKKKKISCDSEPALSSSLPLPQRALPTPKPIEEDGDAKSHSPQQPESWSVLGEETNPVSPPAEQRTVATAQTPGEALFAQMCEDSGYKNRLPTSGMSGKGIPYITTHTVRDLVEGRYEETIKRYVIVDCRYPYEYQGGHIPNAINLLGETHGIEYFFKTRVRDPELVIIFHCEFSANRGPKMSQAVRSYDRDTENRMHWPRLTYPEIYIMKDGYKEFHKNHPASCEPPHAYVPMRHNSHRDECKRMTSFLRRSSTFWKSKAKKERSGTVSDAPTASFARGLEGETGSVGEAGDSDGAASSSTVPSAADHERVHRRGMKKSRSRLNLDLEDSPKIQGRGGFGRTSSMSCLFGTEEDKAPGSSNRDTGASTPSSGLARGSTTRCSDEDEVEEVPETDDEEEDEQDMRRGAFATL